MKSNLSTISLTDRVLTDHYFFDLLCLRKHYHTQGGPGFLLRYLLGVLQVCTSYFGLWLTAN